MGDTQLPNRVQALRIAAKMTLRELQRRTGVHYTQLWRLEHQRGTVNDAAKQRIANALGTSVADVFFPSLVENQSASSGTCVA